MAAAVPKSEVNQIIDDISVMMKSVTANEFALRQMERKAETWLDSGAIAPCYYHMLLGLIGLLRGERERAEAAVRNSVALAPYDGAVLMNGLSVFMSFCSVKEGIHLIKSMSERHPDDKEILACAIMQAHDALQLSYARELLDKLDMLRVNDLTDPVHHRKTLMLSSAAAEAYGMTDSDLADRLETAVGAVRGYGLEVERTSSLTLHDGTFVYQLHIRADRTVCAEANFRIADALVEKYEDTGIELFNIMCRPVEDFHEDSSARCLA